MKRHIYISYAAPFLGGVAFGSFLAIILYIHQSIEVDVVDLQVEFRSKAVYTGKVLMHLFYLAGRPNIDQYH